MKRNYIVVINESWTNGEKYLGGDIFNVFSNKPELQYYFDLAKNKKEIHATKKENYEIYIILYEFSLVRYQFEFEYGLISYFDSVINNPDKDMYDKLLKCLNYNYFKYDYNGNLIESYPNFINPINGDIHFNNLDASLLEKDCIDTYMSNLNYSYYTKFNNQNKKYKKFTNFYLCNIYIERVPYDKTDSGIEQILLFIGAGNLNTAKDECVRELLSNAYISYMSNINEDDITNNELLKIINNNFIDYSVEIFIINNKCAKIFNTNNIKDLMKGN